LPAPRALREEPDLLEALRRGEVLSWAVGERMTDAIILSISDILDEVYLSRPHALRNEETVDLSRAVT